MTTVRALIESVLLTGNVNESTRRDGDGKDVPEKTIDGRRVFKVEVMENVTGRNGDQHMQLCNYKVPDGDWREHVGLGVKARPVNPTFSTGVLGNGTHWESFRADGFVFADANTQGGAVDGGVTDGAADDLIEMGEE